MAELSEREQLRRDIAKALLAKRSPLADVQAAFDIYERTFAKEGFYVARLTTAGECVELADAVMPFFSKGTCRHNGD